MSISPDRSPGDPAKPFGARHRARALALLIAALLSIGAVACGSDDGGDDTGTGNAETSEQEPLGKNAYLEEVNRAQTDFAARAAKLNLANPSSPRGFGKSLDKLGGLIDDLTKRLDDVEPPEAVSAQHDALVSQLTEYSDAIAEQRGGLSSGDQQKVVASATKIGKASTTFSEDFQRTIARINDRLK